MLRSMKLGRGFTVVELVITMTIMVILAGLGTVVVTKLIPEARDRERADDIAVIARGLEAYYEKGNPLIPTSTRSTKGTYPGSTIMLALMQGDSGACTSAGFPPASCPISHTQLGTILPGVNLSNVTPPSSSDANTQILRTIQADNGDIDTQFDNYLSQGLYVYFPYDALDGTACALDCRAYRLIYKDESGGPSKNIQSKHQ